MSDSSRTAAYAGAVQQPPAGANAGVGPYADYQQQQWQWQQYWQAQQQQGGGGQPPPPGSAPASHPAAYPSQQGYGASEERQVPGYGADSYGSAGGNSYYQSGGGDRYGQSNDSYGRYGDRDSGYGGARGHSGSHSDGGYDRHSGGGGGGYRGGSSEYGGRGRGNYRGGYHQQGGGGGGGGGGGSSGGGGGDSQPTYMEQKDCIFIQGLPESCTEDMLVQFFSALGPIKEDDRNGKPKVYIYKDKQTNRPKGEATVTFVDEALATAAVDRYNGQYFPGGNNTMKVSIAKRRFDPTGGAGGRGGFGGGDRGGRGGFGRGGRGGGRGRGDFGGRGGGGDRGGRRGGGPISGANMEGRSGDWVCPGCSNNNFAFRKSCNQCQAPKPDDAGGGGGYGGREGGGPMRGGREGGSSRWDSGRGGDSGGRSRPY